MDTVTANTIMSGIASGLSVADALAAAGINAGANAAGLVGQGQNADASQTGDIVKTAIVGGIGAQTGKK